MYFNDLLCIDLNFDLNIPRNTNKGDGTAISFGSIINCHHSVHKIVRVEGRDSRNIDNNKCKKCQFVAISGN